MIHTGQGSVELTESVKALVMAACTPHGSPPRRAINHQGSVDAPLQQHVCDIIEVLGADGAADEQRALRSLSGRNGGGPAFFPNVKMQLVDKTHASSRLTRKPWNADQYDS